MDNQLTRWWKGGSVGSLDTNVNIDDKMIIKVAVTVILVFLIVFISYKLINKHAVK